MDASGTFQTFIRDLNALESRPLGNSKGSYTVFWAPDGRSLFMTLRGHLQRSTLDGDGYQVVCDTPPMMLTGALLAPNLLISGISTNDGTANVMSATLFAASGSLFATFNTDRLDPVSGNITPGILNKLYRINPATAVATIVAPTAQDLSAVTQVSGTSYAFNVGTQQLLSLNLANGGTSFVAGVSPGPLYVEGATPTPEPFSMALAGLGIAALIVCRLRKQAQSLS